MKNRKFTTTLWRCEKYIGLFTLCLVLIILYIVYSYLNFDPTHNVYAPKCLFFTLTGYKCPGCGCQRLLYHLANGNFNMGLRYNYYFLISSIYLIFILIGPFFSPIKKICYSKHVVITFIFLTLAWFIVRNILNI